MQKAKENKSEHNGKIGPKEWSPQRERSVKDR